MPEWVKVGTDLGVGAAGGVLSKLAENADTKKQATQPTKALGFFEKMGNWVDYGVPILGVAGSLLGFLRGDWETRVLVAGGTLAGRRVTGEMTKPKSAAGWTPVPKSPAPSGGGRQAAVATYDLG